MKLDKGLIWIIIVLLLAVDFLAFHDTLERHTLRDWLTLLASILVFVYFAREIFGKK